jgi:histidyl-tRNA synthetase
MAKDKTKKPRRPRAEAPRGFRDYFGPEVRARGEMLARIAEVYHAWGFDPLETSAVETVEALGKFLPDVDRPNEGVFAWQDEDETWLALRYDLTAPLARVFAQHRASLPLPYRRYQVGPVWRNEKPGPGRFRQFYQCDADTVGSASVAADAEMCAMLCEALEAAGIARGDYLVRVNDRKVLNGVMEVAGILDPADPDRDADRRGIVMRAIDKLDRLGEAGVRALLGAGRRDESGDFTPGAELSAEQVEIVMGFVSANRKIEQLIADHASGNIEAGLSYSHVTRALHSLDEGTMRPLGTDPAAAAIRSIHSVRYLRDIVETSQTGCQGVDELETIAGLLDAQGYGPDRIVIDPSVVRGLGYYTGPVYEAELTFEIVGDDGKPRQFGSVAGGGRYDDLVRRFTGETVAATGVSIGVDRLLAALGEKGRLGAEEAGPVVVTVMDRDRMADYQAMAAELRRAGLRAEVFLGGGNLARQLKYADQRRSAVAVIEGGDEKARGVVQLKDLALGARLASEIATHEDWRAQPAQVEVARPALVAEVRAMLARGA